LKILAPCATLDLKYHLGCTPSWWQLFKALHETGHEVVTLPYLGDSVESLWWRTYPNPCAWESKLYNAYLESRKQLSSQYKPEENKPNGNSSNLHQKLSNRYIKDKWKRCLEGIFKKEKEIDAVLFINIPLNHIRGLPTFLQQEYGVPVGYLEGDMPTILPQFAVERGFKFNYYTDADLSEFDCFFTNSKGVIPDLKKIGAKNIHPLYYAADPDLFQPLQGPKDIDVSFYGHGTEMREEWMTRMITEPSRAIQNAHFSVGGKDINIDLGNAQFINYLSYSAFREFCCRSKICLNITRVSHTNVYASSTARPFELAAFGACIVSQPYNGIEEWFTPGRELVLVDQDSNIREIYQWLLASDKERERIGNNARQKIIDNHTYRHRAREVVEVLMP
jgi:hypothetical protein